LRGERRSLRTLPGASLRAPLAFDDDGTPRTTEPREPRRDIISRRRRRHIRRGLLGRGDTCGVSDGRAVARSQTRGGASRRRRRRRRRAGRLRGVRVAVASPRRSARRGVM
jgi:hypothetical protein